MSFGGQPPAHPPHPASGSPSSPGGRPAQPAYGTAPQPLYGRPPQPLYGRPPQPLHASPSSAIAPHGSTAGAPVFSDAVGAPPAPVPPSPAPALPALPMPARKGRSVSIWVFGALGFALMALVAYFALFLGTAASVVGLILALVPLGIVLFGVRLIDRWEPEPKSLVIFAL